jgi:hypothetical protein
LDAVVDSGGWLDGLDDSVHTGRARGHADIDRLRSGRHIDLLRIESFGRLQDRTMGDVHDVYDVNCGFVPWARLGGDITGVRRQERDRDVGTEVPKDLLGEAALKLSQLIVIVVIII